MTESKSHHPFTYRKVHRILLTLRLAIEPSENFYTKMSLSNMHSASRNPLIRWLPLLLVVIACSFSTVTAASDEVPHRLLSMCSGKTPITKKSSRRYKQLRWLLQASGEGSLALTTSPQHLAACWILYTDHRSQKRSNKADLLQRYALATLYYATTRSNSVNWDWEMTHDEPAARAVKGYWMSPSKHECSWYGVKCQSTIPMVTRQKIVGLTLGWLKLDGLVPRELGLLTELKEVDLHGCDLQGIIPHKMLASLPKLEYLRLHMNGFFGAIHREIKGMTSLKQLILFGNYLAGTVPPVLAELKNLEVIDLYANQLSGTIPSELGKLKKLRSLDLHDNNLVGSMPREICNLRLDELVADCLGPNPEVRCDCCTKCCKGLPEMKCVDVATGAVVK